MEPELVLPHKKNWEVNNPKELAKVLAKLKKVQKAFNSELSDGKKVSLADTIVLGGAAAIEKAARKAGVTISVPFRAGRVDASQKQTDVSSFENLRPLSDPFRNYYSSENYMSPTQSMIDRANMLALTVPQMTALVGGMRVLGANSTGSTHGIFTKKVGTLSNDFFVNLLDMSTEWKKSSKDKGVYEGFDRKTGKLKWTGTSVDLIFGSHSELRAIAEVYGANDGKRKFVKDFVKAWSKVMQADRFDLR